MAASSCRFRMAAPLPSNERCRSDAGTHPVHTPCHGTDRPSKQSLASWGHVAHSRICKIRRRPRLACAATACPNRRRGRPGSPVYHPGGSRRGPPITGARCRGLTIMLTREQLTDEQWRTLRNTPHHVAIAVSAAGGSIFDERPERAAAMAGIVDALNSRHPLVQGIGASADIMAAQAQLRSWYHDLEDSERHAATLQAKALAMFKDAIAMLEARGQR